MYRPALVLMIIMIFCMKSTAQKTSPEQVERITANLFIYKQWKALIHEGEQALKEGTDFNNLQIRMGIAWFEIKNYMKAIPYLEKSYYYNPGDTVILEYLYFAYSFSNRKIEAYLLLKDNKLILNQKLSKEYQKSFIEDISIGGGIVFSNNDIKNSNINIDGEKKILGMIDRIGNADFLTASLKHKILPGLSLSHTYNYIYIRKTQEAERNGKSIFAENNNITQHEYFGSLDYFMGNKINLNAGIHYLNVSYLNKYFIVMKPGIPPVPQFAYENVKLNNMVYFLGLNRNFILSKAGLSFSYSNLNNKKQYQGNLIWAYFPKGNLNFYTVAGISGQYQDTFRLIGDLKAGMRILPKVWLEGYFTYGEMTNYVSDNASIIYNLSDMMESKWGTNLIFAINKKIELGLYFQHTDRKDYYSTFINPGKFENTYFYYQTNSITGGLKWIL